MTPSPFPLSFPNSRAPRLLEFEPVSQQFPTNSGDDSGRALHQLPSRTYRRSSSSIPVIVTVTIRAALSSLFVINSERHPRRHPKSPSAEGNSGDKLQAKESTRRTKLRHRDRVDRPHLLIVWSVILATAKSAPILLATKMSIINESVKKGPVMTLTIECETEFPKALKNLMISMGMNGEAVYKGFPVLDEGQEYWWVQLHLYENKGDDHKTDGRWMFTNPELYMSFFDSARSAAWSAIGELGERLRYRMHNTQKDLREEKQHTQDLETKANQLRSDAIDMALALCAKDAQNSAKDAMIAALKK